jgi:hypothetical protein
MRRALAFLRRHSKTFVALITSMGIITAFLVKHYFDWRNLEVSREGQITERYTEAIDQLGNDKLQVRLGGIYELERIARESEPHHWRIMEILTAYVRKNAPRQDFKTYKETPSAKPEADIQAILTVLRERTWSREGANQRLNLAHTNLRGADLRGAHLERAILRDTHLHDAILDGAHLEGADFTDAGMAGASFVGADLRGAINSKPLKLSSQLSSVKSLHGAHLDPRLPEEIRQKYPHRSHILEKPED